MNSELAPGKGQISTAAVTKKRCASTTAGTKKTTSEPVTKKARLEAKKSETVKDQVKKGPACAACRKKKIKCAHRLELGSVTKQPPALSPITNEQTKSSTLPKTHPSSSVKNSESQKKDTTAAPKPIQKLDKDRNATQEYRLRIAKDRRSCTIQFTKEDWEREPTWASRVYGDYSSVDELRLHAESSRSGESSAGTIPSLSVSETNSLTSSDFNTSQSFVEYNPEFSPNLAMEEQSVSGSDECPMSSGGYPPVTLPDGELKWLRKTESWKDEAIALLYDEKLSSDDHDW